MSLAERSVVAVAPRWGTQRTDRPTAGGEATKVARKLGYKLLPWQQHVFDVSLEYEHDPDYPGSRNFVYREVNFGTPRQSGKSIWCLVKLLHRSMMMGDRQASVYTMQTGADASRRMLDEWMPEVMASPLRPAVEHTRRSIGAERVLFRGHSTIEILRSGKSAGHGRTLDEGHLDEAMHDVDDRREQAVIPSMVTRPNAQMIATSTAGTDESLYWRRKVDEGRKFAEDGLTSDVCYFEWSIPDDADIYDESVWVEFHPALGHTQQLGALRHAARTMGEMEFRRAFGNQWTRQNDKVIDWGAWIECRNSHSKIARDMVLAVDMNKERTAASICAASWGEDGLVDIELIERNEGITWITNRLVELRDRHMPQKIMLDGAGPIGALLPEFERAGLDVNPLGAGELAKACGGFYDRILARTVRVRPNATLDEAVSGAAKYQRGDSFIWRRSTPACDISPLVCATLACWGVAGESNHGALWMY